MSGEIFGLDGLVIAFLMLATLVLPIWAVVDAASRPYGAFSAAGSSKVLWIVLIIVFWLFTWIIGVVLSIVYLAAIRPRVRAMMPDRGRLGPT